MHISAYYSIGFASSPSKSVPYQNLQTLSLATFVDLRIFGCNKNVLQTARSVMVGREIHHKTSSTLQCIMPQSVSGH